MATYTPSMVEKYLRNMLDIIYMLDGGTGGSLPDNHYIRTKTITPGRERPLGMSVNDPRSWPFREPLHAKEPFDGKTKARAIEELHCGVIDIELALNKKDKYNRYIYSDEDLDLIVKHHIFQTHTLDELVVERQVTSRGSMQKRVFRAVQRLTVIMEEAQ